MAKPHYSLETAPSDVPCSRCGNVVPFSGDRLVKTEKRIFSTQWTRQHYCLECGMEILSDRKQLALRKALGAGFQGSDLYKLVLETNRKNGYDFSIRGEHNDLSDTF
jgi:hypothetical protein